MFKYLLLCAVAIGLSACVSNELARGGSLSGNDANVVTDGDMGTPVTLTDYLGRVAGVNIFGSGASAFIRIRGPQSFYSGEGPLFVVDGTQMGFDYSRIYNAISVQDIQSVRVLKNASETGVYGVRGATGVVEITLKK